jgi:hypothetical protein
MNVAITLSTPKNSNTVDSSVPLSAPFVDERLLMCASSCSRRTSLIAEHPSPPTTPRQLFETRRFALSTSEANADRAGTGDDHQRGRYVRVQCRSCEEVCVAGDRKACAERDTQRSGNVRRDCIQSGGGVGPSYAQPCPGERGRRRRSASRKWAEVAGAREEGSPALPCESLTLFFRARRWLRPAEEDAWSMTRQGG